MKTKLYLILALLIAFNVSAQVSTYDAGLDGKFYSKIISEYRAKKYLMEEVIGDIENTVEFNSDALAASTAGELTTLYYKCEKKNLEGLLLGFYGDYWNKEGVVYQGFAFKNLPREEAIEFLSKIEEVLAENKSFLFGDIGNNTIVFKYDDMKIMAWSNYQSFNMRIFWGNFDSEWETTSFNRSKKRFLKKLD
ncbi:hypothetical protein [Seonamhaeicola sp.]|uniref:hypothetical protein n=1 Tax=Seonamhaeicola sp. TaxID=1912245 RepID=UPI00356944A3